MHDDEALAAGPSDLTEGGAAELLARHRRVLPKWIALYYEQPLQLVRGAGTRVWDASGKEYLDFFGGILTTISGHGVPAVVEALRAQAGALVHTSTAYLIEPMIELAERLTKLAPIDGPSKAFFVNSGTEAVEAALLLATNWRGSNEIIALGNSYHGGSFGTIAVTGNRSWSPTSYSPLTVSYAPAPYCYRCPLNLTYPSCGIACAEQLRTVLATTTSGPPAAMIAEPIQGIGGVVTPPREYFPAVKSILDEQAIPLISDEVQTGFGRTGEAFWGIEAAGVHADAITCAKGLANGLAVGALVGRSEMVDAMGANHISTFGGNPLVATVAMANLDYLIGENLQQRSHDIGMVLRNRLDPMADRYGVVGEVRGKGLMIGIELVSNSVTKRPSPEAASRVLEVCRSKGVLVGKGGLYGNVLRVTPPLVATAEEADRAADALEEGFREAEALVDKEQ